MSAIGLDQKSRKYKRVVTGRFDGYDRYLGTLITVLSRRANVTTRLLKSIM